MEQSALEKTISSAFNKYNARIPGYGDYLWLKTLHRAFSRLLLIWTLRDLENSALG